MRNTNTNPIFTVLAKLLCAHGFYKRGTAFFRITGDGILQVLQYENVKHSWPHEDINIGLFSLYGPIEPEWLTARGCIPRYNAHWLEEGVKQRYRDVREKGHATLEEVSSGECYGINLPFIEYKLIPFLDSVQTQAQLVDAIQLLDREASGPVAKTIIWNDETKIAPFLHSEQYDKAAFVLESILNQHAYAKARNQALGFSVREIDDSNFLCLQKLIRESSYEGIQEYLHRNYTQNLNLTAFLR